MEKFKKWLEGKAPLYEEQIDDEIDRTKIINFKRHHVNALSSHERKKLVNFETDKISKLHLVLATISFIAYIAILICNAANLQAFGKTNTAWNYVAKYYIEHSLVDTKAVNSITGMILDYRAFDTLGESFVLFSALTCVFVLLHGLSDEEEINKQNTGFLVHLDPIVKCVASILMPIIFIFGIYIVLNGHLSPGGGFSGGAIIGAALILFSLAFGDETAKRFFNIKTFKWITSLSLFGYAVTKCYSFFMGGMGYHDPIANFFHGFSNGSIVSGGYILFLNIFVGSVVACTMYGFYLLFKKGEI